MAQQQTTAPPAPAADDAVLDGNGNPVKVPAFIIPDATFRAFMAGRVPAKDCEHYMFKSEAEVGFTRCEHCRRPS